VRLKEEEARDEHGREDDHEPIVRLLPPAEAEAEARDPKVVAEILADGRSGRRTRTPARG
jgi:hypothetical protein